MSLAATVLIPTFDHGPTLARSLRSALRQTVEDLEVFVIGDGVPDISRQILAEVMAEDSRVRFFDHPKGPRNGEAYRHPALAEARGRIVCYLSDDDFWLPDHVETMQELLREADFAHVLPLVIFPGGVLKTLVVDLAHAEDRDLILRSWNRIPLPCSGHTLELYRRLPHGWRTTPPGIPTDHYMFQQILSVPGIRAASGMKPTVIHLSSSKRKGVAIEDRLVELDAWVERLATPEGRAGFTEEVLEEVARDRANLDRQTRALYHSRALTALRLAQQYSGLGRLRKWAARRGSGEQSR
jgi:hypothetical protein